MYNTNSMCFAILHVLISSSDVRTENGTTPCPSPNNFRADSSVEECYQYGDKDFLTRGVTKSAIDVVRFKEGRSRICGIGQ